MLVLPFAVYMIAGSLDPSPGQDGGKILGLAIPYSAYPLLYTVKIALTLAAVVFVLPAYPTWKRPSPLAFVVGAVGIFVWVGLWMLTQQWNPLEMIGLGRIMDLSARPAFNPFEHVSSPWVWAFLAVRFLGLAVIVPVIEELFLRGFLMRFVMQADWWNVPFGKVNAAAVAVSVVVPALSHPAEMLPAIVWFGMVTLLMVKTRNIWDCVVAHAVTNLLLGIYVVATGHWALW